MASYKTKQMEEETKDALDDQVADVDVEAPGEGGVAEGADEPDEKYSAQVLRRLHEDASILLEEYDEMRGPLEHQETDAHLEKKLEALVAEIEEIEALFAKHHPDAKALEGAEAPDVTETETEDKDLDEGTEEKADETDAVEADSKEEEEPTPDEVVEGMENKKKRLSYHEMKQLRKHYTKSVCKCGKKSCSCGKKSMDANEDKCMEDPHANQPGPCPGKSDKKDANVQEQMDTADNTAEVQHKGLEPHEKEKVGEASEYLKELGTTDHFEDEHRMKSYYHHKTLHDIAHKGMTEGDVSDNTGMEGATDPEMKSQIPGDRNYWEEEANEAEHKGMHPHRKACKDASMFFKSLSTERNFGDPHREKAMHFHKALDPLSKEDNEVNVQEGDKEPPPVNPGDMDTKALKETFLQQDQCIKELQRKLSMLVA